MKHKQKTKGQKNMTNPNTDLINGSKKIGKLTIPPMSLKSIILFEAIGSPFVEKRDPKCPRCDKQFDDDRPAEDIKNNTKIECPQCGKKFQISISITDLSEALYILVNQSKEDIGEIVQDSSRFKTEVLKMAAEMTMAEINDMTGTINMAMTRVNDLATESGAKGGSAKNVESGPSE